jgi:hypothetical protein
VRNDGIEVLRSGQALRGENGLSFVAIFGYNCEMILRRAVEWKSN